MRKIFVFSLTEFCFLCSFFVMFVFIYLFYSLDIYAIKKIERLIMSDLNKIKVVIFEKTKSQ